MDDYKFYRMTYVEHEKRFTVTNTTEHAIPRAGHNTSVPVICVHDRLYDGDVNAIVTDYGVYVNVGDYGDAILN